jgi:hypothetical protein
MKKGTARNVRRRDDRRLRDLVGQARAAMQAQGIEEHSLDWEAVARDERRRFWQDRLRASLGDLTERVAHVAEAGAEAAFEVAMDAAHRVGRVLIEPACVRDPAGLQLTYVGAADRSRLGLAAGGDESVVVFVTSTIAGARVIADAANARVVVEFRKSSSPLVVVLVPEDPVNPARMAHVTPADHTARSVFDHLDEGRYLLVLLVVDFDETGLD